MHGIGNSGSSNAADIAGAAQRAATQAAATSSGSRLSSSELIGRIVVWGDQSGSNGSRFSVVQALRQFIEFPPPDGRLILSGHVADELPPEIGDLHGVSALVIDDMPHLTRLPEDIGRVAGLQELSISRLDGVTELPASLGQLNDVQHLSVRCLPQLTSFPASIGTMAELNRITLADLPGITMLPDEISALEHLNDISLLNLPNLAQLGPAVTGRAINMSLHQMPDHVVEEALQARSADGAELHVEVSDSLAGWQRRLLSETTQLVRDALAAEPRPLPRDLLDRLLDTVADHVLQTSIHASRTDRGPELISAGVRSARDYLTSVDSESESIQSQMPPADASVASISPRAQVMLRSHEVPDRQSNVTYPASASSQIPGAPPNTPQSDDVRRQSVQLFASLSLRLAGAESPPLGPTQISTLSISLVSPIDQSTEAIYGRVLARVAEQLPAYDSASIYIFGAEATHPRLLDPEDDHIEYGSSFSADDDHIEYGSSFSADDDHIEYESNVSADHQ